MWTTSSLWWVLWWGTRGSSRVPAGSWLSVSSAAHSSSSANRAGELEEDCSALFAPNLPMDWTSGKKNKMTDGTSVEGLRHLLMPSLAVELQPHFQRSWTLAALALPHSMASSSHRPHVLEEDLAKPTRKTISSTPEMYHEPVYVCLMDARTKKKANQPMGDVGYKRHKAIKGVSRSLQCRRRDSAAEGPTHLCATRPWLQSSLNPHHVFPFVSTANWHFLAVFSMWSVLVQDRVIIKLIRSSLQLFLLCLTGALPAPPRLADWLL